MTRTTMITLTVAALAAAVPAVAAGDAARGKAKFEAACAECHQVGDFKRADFGAKLGPVLAGTKKHRPKLKLTEGEVADLTAAIGAK